ncbi:MFS transporter [Paenibacillus terrigena]|uniref:MFS transporter n=1 Tax=Paenibacillus terrigena TaxID=369333 RepID=UPI0028D1C596|nr:MFS transporter [Paenibacillus terrigena]
MKERQVPWRERISYSLTDTASNLVFQVVTTYLLFYYTDSIGISAGVVGTLFLIARVIDAFDSPFFGILIDKTNTRWGKSRPWFLWLALPFSVVAVLTFSVPDISPTGQIVYAYVTYILLGILYAGINLPVTSILPSLSSNPQERTVIGVVRMICAMVGTVAVTTFTLPIVNKLGQGDDAKGFTLTMIIFASIAFVLFINAFLQTKERVGSEVTQKSLPFREGIKAIKGNSPWYIMLFLNFIFWVANIMKTQTTTYYFTYKIGRPDLIPTAMALNMVLIVTLVMVPFFTKRIGKRNTMLIGMIVSIIGQLVMFLGDQNSNIGLLLGGSVVVGLGGGFVAGLLFIMIVDTVDYGEWKTGVRAQGLLTASSSFGVKFGMGIGGALSAWMLSLSGYKAGATQSSSALFAIDMNFIWVPIICYILAVIALMFYKLDKVEKQMLADLEARHRV